VLVLLGMGRLLLVAALVAAAAALGPDAAPLLLTLAGLCLLRTVPHFAEHRTPRGLAPRTVPVLVRSHHPAAPGRVRPRAPGHGLRP
jgi:hypothetical protein